MVFKIKPPEQPGYYWMVDISYPIPQIVFYYNFQVYPLNSGTFDIRMFKNYRFGDEIEQPNIVDNTIEK